MNVGDRDAKKIIVAAAAPEGAMEFFGSYGIAEACPDTKRACFSSQPKPCFQKRDFGAAEVCA
jgi:hypothetical protein